MKNKKTVLACLITVMAGVVCLAIWAQQKKSGRHADFSGEWKSRQSISVGGNIVCSYDEGDRMLANRMTITAQPDFLTIATPGSPISAAQAANLEKLAFDGKESQIKNGTGRVKKVTAKRSADGFTVTVNSIVQWMTATPYHVDIQKQAIVYVTEVWNLSDDGKSITVLANAKSNLFGGERNWKTVFDRTD